MKKVIKVFLFVTIFLLLPSGKTLGWEEEVDQQNSVISQAYVTIGTYGHNQTFTPSFDHITKAQFYLKDRVAGDGITITLLDEESSTEVFSSTKHISDDGDGFEVFDLAIGVHPDGYELTSDQKYSFWLEVDNTTTGWVRSGTDSYESGERRQGTTVKSDDFAFATFGYTTEEAPQDPEPDSPPEDPQPSEEQEEPQSEQNQTDANNQTTEHEISSEEAETVVDEQLSMPVLTHLQVNEEEIEVPIEETVKLESKDNMILKGTSFENATVVLFIGEKAFFANASEDGSWSKQINAKDLETGTYTLKAQAQNKQDFGSDLAEFFEVEVAAEPLPDLVPTNIEKQKDILLERLLEGDLRFITVLLLILTLAGLFAAFYKLRKGKEEKVKKDEKEIEADKTEKEKKIQNSKE